MRADDEPIAEPRSQAARRYLAAEVWPLLEPDQIGQVPPQSEQDVLLGYDDDRT